MTSVHKLLDENEGWSYSPHVHQENGKLDIEQYRKDCPEVGNLKNGKESVAMQASNRSISFPFY